MTRSLLECPRIGSILTTRQQVFNLESLIRTSGREDPMMTFDSLTIVKLIFGAAVLDHFTKISKLI